MAGIFLLINSDFNYEHLVEMFNNQHIKIHTETNVDDSLYSKIQDFEPDVILLEASIENIKVVLRQIRAISKNQNARIIILKDDNLDYDCYNLIDGIVQMPCDDENLSILVTSNIKTKKSLDRLFENNRELSRSLYQLNVLYNTSSQFAGTLNTKRLYEIMLEAMEKTLSFDVSAVLLFNTNQKPVFNLSAIHTPSENLTDALKLRSILNYQSLFENNTYSRNNAFKDIEITQKIKQTRSGKIFGLEIINFDSLFAPIKVGDEIFGVVELFRKTPFQSEDVTCFQAIAHQVALPLRSAKLYEEISLTNKKLEKLEKLKSEFISIVSHELRTPLQPIKNSLEIVLSRQAGEISSDVENFVSMAKRNIQRLEGIIGDLLDLSRIEAGKFDFNYEISDIVPSLELLKNTFVQVAQEKNISLTLSCKGEMPKIFADTRRIEQIISNLVSNSLKFTPKDGKIEVIAEKINTSEIDEKKLIMPICKPRGDYIKISVKDNGIGINEKDIPKIFDKFSQIESSLNRNKGGVGLGLTITKQLIDAHFGLIWVESEEKKGSVFNVLLPCYDEKKAFKMKLFHMINLGKDVGLIKLTVKNRDEIEELKTKKLINLTSHSEELFVEDKDKIDYYFFSVKISFESFSAYCKTLKENCDIMLLEAHSLSKDDIQKIVNEL
ncbi:GAF domain-containing sensor histidine kinase [bacterium]|nr:GAF domain-containing sensor histidine kinase [bacterium]